MVIEIQVQKNNKAPSKDSIKAGLLRSERKNKKYTSY